MTAEEITNYLTASALILSAIAIFIQVRVYSQEWRPILTYKSLQIQTVVDTNSKTGTTDIVLYFDNSGKCPLKYEMKNLQVYFNGMKQPDVDETSTGSVVGVGQTVTYNRFYRKPIEINGEVIPFAPSTVKLKYDLEYSKISKRSKKYFINYVIDANVSGNSYRSLFHTTLAT